METINPILALLVGTIMILSIIWQIHLYEDHGEKYGYKTILPPVAISFILAFGIIIVSTISLIDQRNPDFTWLVFLLFLFKAIVLVIVVAFKAIIAVIVTGFIVSSELYILFEYGEFRPIPILTELFNWIFSFGPDWLGTAWVLGQALWSTSTSVVLTIYDSK